MNKTSKGEEKVIFLLQKSPFKFEREKTFQDLRKGLYRFDFYLPSLNTCIEVDGAQHFEQVKHFHKTRQDYLKAKERDRRKNSYCLAHKIKLLRIPYWELEDVKHYSDLFQQKFIVTTKYHNDYIKPKKIDSFSKKTT